MTLRNSVEDMIFQSTHSYRVRLNMELESNTSMLFNPRTHLECDKESKVCKTSRLHFNPRTHLECDRVIMIYPTAADIFQSTHSYRVRLRFPP